MMKVDTSRCSGNEPALLPRKGEPERTAEIKPNGAPLFHSLLTLQMHITRAVHNNQEGTDAFEFVIYPVVGHDGSVTSVNFSHDNNWLLTSSCDRTVRLWSHSQSDPLLTLSSVTHNFATELGSSAKLKVSGLIYFGDPLFASGQQTVTKCMGDSRELTRKPHTKGNAASPLACSLAGCFARQNWRA